MNIQRLFSKVAFLISVATASLLSNTALAGCGTCCVCQAKRCHVTVDTEEVDVECRDVECEDICIPPVRFWWECGPLKPCGRIRTVRKLVTETHTKKVCTYDWSVVTVCKSCYRKIHRLRCKQLHLSENTPPEQVGLPAMSEDGTIRMVVNEEWAAGGFPELHVAAGKPQAAQDDQSGETEDTAMDYFAPIEVNPVPAKLESAVVQ
ncbi:hypothetical protein [Crateriforma spongiae]|uniref:hypothetical protein n=1 Tax=Crateriforma spongiae TaxID=2724528 RepID=UPI0014451F91|nr:hypothetical protein [Crateriforma spongiae]